MDSRTAPAFDVFCTRRSSDLAGRPAVADGSYPDSALEQVARAAVGAGFEALTTVDQSVPFQQNVPDFLDPRGAP